MQFTSVTCSLPVKTGKLTRVYAASTSCRIQANCPQPYVNLPEYNEYFTGNFTCGTHANLPTTSMENCLLLQAKIHAIGMQKHPQSQAKIPWFAGESTRRGRQKHTPLQLQIPTIAAKIAIILRVKSPANYRLHCILLVKVTANCEFKYEWSRVLCVRCLSHL